MPNNLIPKHADYTCSQCGTKKRDRIISLCYEQKICPSCMNSIEIDALINMDIEYDSDVGAVITEGDES